MNYRHIYHAGGFADVIKHLVLVALILQLKKKEKPFAVLDCFTGTGKYNLASTDATKTNESRYGIYKLLDFIKTNNCSLPPLLSTYIDLVMQAGKNIYPGSPYIIAKMLRSNDRLIASELHYEDYIKLKALFRRYENVYIHHIDGHLASKSFLPFKEKRGLVFIDPAYEVKDEFSLLIASLKIIKQRHASSPTLLWYPIKNIKQVQNFYNDCSQLGFREIIKIEFSLLVDIIKNPLNKTEAMKECGLLIFNPPQISELLAENFAFLVKEVYDYTATYRLNIL